MNKRSKAIALFSIAMLLFHYHSTVHFVWAMLGIPYTFPLDPVDGWWALLKGFLPFGTLFLVFYTGIITKRKSHTNEFSI